MNSWWRNKKNILFTHLGQNGKSYANEGCWIHKDENRTLSVRLEDKCSESQADLHQRCRKCARENGYALYGLFNGGECWAGHLGENYMKNGRAYSCGKIGPRLGSRDAMFVRKLTGNNI